MVVLDPRTGRLVSISLGIQSEMRGGPAVSRPAEPRPARPPGERPPHQSEPQGSLPAHLRVRREES